MDREERRALVSFSIKFTRSFLFVLLACNLIEINTPVPLSLILCHSTFSSSSISWAFCCLRTFPNLTAAV